MTIMGAIASQITSLTSVYGLFGRRSKKTSKLGITGLCARNSPVTGEFPAQKASDAENVSIWWRHHGSRNGWVHGEVERIPVACVPIYLSNLIGRCLAKVRAEQTNLLTPTWQDQPWCATLLQMITEKPISYQIWTTYSRGCMGSIRQSAKTALSSTGKSLLQWKLLVDHNMGSTVFLTPMEALAIYLTEEHINIRVVYSLLDTTRSIISSCHDKCNGKPIGL